MGAWGPEAFANDAALDVVADGSLSTVEGVAAALAYHIKLEVDGTRPYGSVEPAYAACEVVAAARAEEPYWQSESTTLGAGPDATPYFPEEVVAFLDTEPLFPDWVCEQALEVIATLEAEVDKEGWRAPAERLRALAKTRERLLQSPPRGWSPVEPGPRERLSPLAERAMPQPAR